MKVILQRIGIVLLCALGLFINTAIVLSAVEDVTNKNTANKAKPTESYSMANVTEDKSEKSAENGNVEKTTESSQPAKQASSQPEWIKVLCPLCDGGKSLTVCPVCKGTDKIKTLLDTDSCYNCDSFNGGYLTCPLCENRYYIVMRNYEADSSVPTPSEIADQIKAIGPKPMLQSLCTYCSGGTKLEKCSNCNGTGNKNEFYGGTMIRSRCSECTKGYILCKHCDKGLVKNENYKTEKAAWKVKRDNILNGVVDTTKSAGEQALDNAAAQAMQQANEMIINDYNAAAGQVGGSYGSGGTGSSSLCRHCYGTGICSMCNGDGRMKNSYLGGDQKCSSCNGRGSCPYCR